MSVLRIYHENDGQKPVLDTDDKAVARGELAKVGVVFEQWQPSRAVEKGAAEAQVLAAFREEIARVQSTFGYVTVDVVSLTKDHPQKQAMREKFLSEHRHSEDEVRFFVAGEGLFSLHIQDRFYEVHCRKGDLISVPRATPHWFDMGEHPDFVAIRFFNRPEGWVAEYTGSDIANRFSRL